MAVIEYEALRGHAERYASMRTQPLRVTCFLREGARLAGYDPLILDNLLAWTVVQEATGGAGLPPEAVNAYALPIPADVLWRSPAGLPLYACTPLLPAGESAADVNYWHKRLQSGRWSRGRNGSLTLYGQKGRYMERRVPLPSVVCREWVGWCVGNGEEIARLLQRCVFIGKKRHTGLGEVAKWRVEPAQEFRLVECGVLMRSVPVGAVELLPNIPVDMPAPVGWTPPQWKPALWLPGWRQGANLHG